MMALDITTFHQRFDRLRDLMIAYGINGPVRGFFGFDINTPFYLVDEAIGNADWLDGAYAEVIFLAKLRLRDE